MKTLDALFTHFLRDIYYAEKQVLKTLPKMARTASSEDLKEAFEHHREETEEQIENLEKVFDLLGIKARGVTCDAILGILDEKCLMVGNQTEKTAEVIQHGASLGFGLAAMGTGSLDHWEKLKNVLYSDSAVAGEGAKRSEFVPGIRPALFRRRRVRPRRVRGSGRRAFRPRRASLRLSEFSVHLRAHRRFLRREKGGGGGVVVGGGGGGGPTVVVRGVSDRAKAGRFRGRRSGRGRADGAELVRGVPARRGRGGRGGRRRFFVEEGRGGARCVVTVGGGFAGRIRRGRVPRLGRRRRPRGLARRGGALARVDAFVRGAARERGRGRCAPQRAALAKSRGGRLFVPSQARGRGWMRPLPAALAEAPPLPQAQKRVRLGRVQVSKHQMSLDHRAERARANATRVAEREGRRRVLAFSAPSTRYYCCPGKSLQAVLRHFSSRAVTARAAPCCLCSRPRAISGPNRSFSRRRFPRASPSRSRTCARSRGARSARVRRFRRIRPSPSLSSLPALTLGRPPSQ